VSFFCNIVVFFLIRSVIYYREKTQKIVSEKNGSDNKVKHIKNSATFCISDASEKNWTLASRHRFLTVSEVENAC